MRSENRFVKALVPVLVAGFLTVFFSTSTFAAELTCDSNHSTRRACQGNNNGVAWMTNDDDRTNDLITVDKNMKAQVYMYGSLYSKTGTISGVSNGAMLYAKHVHILQSNLDHYVPEDKFDTDLEHPGFAIFNDYFRKNNLKRGMLATGFTKGWEDTYVYSTSYMNFSWLLEKDSNGSYKYACASGVEGCYETEVWLYRCFHVPGTIYDDAYYEKNPDTCYSDPFYIRVQIPLEEKKDPEENEETYHHYSKSGVGYNDGKTDHDPVYSPLSNPGQPDTDINRSVKINSKSEDAVERTVQFTHRIYIDLKGQDPTTFKPIVNTTYNIVSDTGHTVVGNTKRTSRANGWVISEDVNGAYVFEIKTDPQVVKIAPGASVKVCQTIKYDHQTFTVKTSREDEDSEWEYSVTYADDKGSSTACISFRRGTPEPEPTPPEYYCEYEKDGKKVTFSTKKSINGVIAYGDTYGWTRVTNLTTGEMKDTMLTGSKGNENNKVTIFAKPGDTISFTHALCYGAQAVRGSNGFVDAGTTLDVTGGLLENHFKISGLYGRVNGDNRSYSVLGKYAFGQFDYDTEVGLYYGVVGQSDVLTLKKGDNKSSSAKNPAVLNTTTGKFNVNAISDYSFYVDSPYIGSTGRSLSELLKCSGTYYEDSFVEGGYQISSSANSNCARGYGSRDVGKGIEQELSYNYVRNWIKEGHYGAADSTYWCKCDPRKAYQAANVPWGVDKEDGYKDADGAYADFYGEDHSGEKGAGDWDKDRTGTDDQTKDPKKESTASIYNIDPLKYEDYQTIGKITAGSKSYSLNPGWVNYKCDSGSNTCAPVDTWTVNPTLKTTTEQTKTISTEKKYNKDDSSKPSIDRSDSGFDSSYKKALTPASGTAENDRKSTSDWQYTSWSNFTSSYSGTWTTDSGASYPGTSVAYDEKEKQYQYYCADSDYTLSPSDGWAASKDNVKCSKQVTDNSGTVTTSTTYTYDCKKQNTSWKTVTPSGTTASDLPQTYSSQASASQICAEKDSDGMWDIVKSGVTLSMIESKETGHSCNDSSYTYNSSTSKCEKQVTDDKGTVSGGTTTRYKYYYYECPSDYPYYESSYNTFTKAYYGSSDSSNVKFPKAVNCYREKYVCPSTATINGLTYRVKSSTTDPEGTSWNSSAKNCGYFGCSYTGSLINTIDGKTQEAGTSTYKAEAVEGGCSVCDWDALKSKHPSWTQNTYFPWNSTLYGLPKYGLVINGQNLYNASLSENGAKTGLGCKFAVNVRPLYTTQANQSKYTVTNNKDEDKEVKKTAEVLVPYNYYITVSSRIGSVGQAFVGEDLSYAFSARVNPRVNSSVSDEAYATYTRTSDDGGTRFQAIQFVIKPTEGNAYTNPKVRIDEQLGSTVTDLCAAFGRTNGENCKEFDTVLEAGALNASGNPQGANVFSQNEWKTMTIPNDLPIGSLYCVAIGAFPGDSHGAGNNLVVSGMSDFSNASWAVSDASCRTVSKKPSMQVWNGGIYTETDVKSTYSNKAADWTWDDITSGNNGIAPESSKSLFASWDEYGITANGLVNNFASGAAIGYGLTNLKYDSVFGSGSGITSAPQTIANTGRGDNFGYSNITGVTPDNMVTKLLALFSENNDKMEIHNNDFGNSIAGLSAAKDGKTQVYISTSGAVKITGNICVGSGTCSNSGSDLKLGERNNTSYTNANQLAQVIIIAPSIIIADSVTQLDAWLIAAETSGTSVIKYGSLSTCDSDVVNSSVCTKTLIVNGPVIAGELRLKRTAGAYPGSAKITETGDLASENLTNNGSATPAEIFNLRPDVYIWAYSQLNKSAQATTTYSRELAPRY